MSSRCVICHFQATATVANDSGSVPEAGHGPLTSLV